MENGVPTHHHKIDRIEEADLIPNGKIYSALPVSAQEGERAILDNGDGTYSFYRWVNGDWWQSGGGGGGGGGVAGSNKNIQYNNGGVLAGSDKLTWDDVALFLTLGDGASDVTIEGKTGTPTLWVQNDGSNVIIMAAAAAIQGGGSRQAWFDTSAIHAGSSRTFTFPDSDGIFALTRDVPSIDWDISPPAYTPTKIGDIFVDVSAKKIYIATGHSSSSDWTIIN